MAEPGRNLVEIAVGLAVLVAAGGFGIAASSYGSATDGGGGYTIIGSFDSLAGVSAGTDVRMAGVKIGRVADIKLNNENFRAEAAMSIDEGVEIPIDSLLKVGAEGLLGGNFISVESGGLEELAEDGEVFENTQGSRDIIDLFITFGQNAAKKADAE